MGFCLGFIIVAAVLCWIAVRGSRKVDKWVASQPANARSIAGAPDSAAQAILLEPPGTIVAQYGGTCAACGQHFVPGTRIYWSKGQPTRHYNCEAARRDREAEAFARLMDRLSNSKGTAGRQHILSQAERNIQDPALRSKLILEASRVEAESALEKAATLKTAPARRRRLQEALDSIRNDPMPDEFQAAEIAMLEDALKALDAEAS